MRAVCQNIDFDTPLSLCKDNFLFIRTDEPLNVGEYL